MLNSNIVFRFFWGSQPLLTDYPQTKIIEVIKSFDTFQRIREFSYVLQSQLLKPCQCMVE